MARDTRPAHSTCEKADMRCMQGILHTHDDHIVGVIATDRTYVQPFRVDGRSISCEMHDPHQYTIMYGVMA